MEFGPIIRSLARNKARYGLIILEIALTLAVVANCVSLALAAREKMSKASGFDDDNILVVHFRPHADEYRDFAALSAARAADVALVRAAPGVRAASQTHFLPWRGGGSSGELKVLDAETEYSRTQMYPCDPDLFETLGVKFVEGRNFTAAEVEQTSETGKFFVTIVSQAYADLLFPDGGALGSFLQNNSGPDSARKIVGIIDPFYNPYGWPIHEFVMFYPTRSGSFGRGYDVLVRTEPGARDGVFTGLEETLLAARSGRNVEVESLVEIRRRFQARDAFIARSMVAVVILLVSVTALGVVGLTAFSVAERTKTIGTRRALGASRTDILRYFLLENFITTTLGIALGLVLAHALSFALGTVSSDDVSRLPWFPVLAGSVVLWLAGLMATFVPALRGARVSPAIATRAV